MFGLNNVSGACPTDGATFSVTPPVGQAVPRNPCFEMRVSMLKLEFFGVLKCASSQCSWRLYWRGDRKSRPVNTSAAAHVVFTGMIGKNVGIIARLNKKYPKQRALSSRGPFGRGI
jgi:hypothetical protein